MACLHGNTGNEMTVSEGDSAVADHSDSGNDSGYAVIGAGSERNAFVAYYCNFGIIKHQ